MSTLRGIAGFTRIRVHEAGEVLALDDEALRGVVQTDAELSEVLLRAFILRRVGLVNSGQAEVTLIGSRHSAATLKLREFFTRNAFPYNNIDVESDPGVQEMLDRFHIAVADIPVVIARGGEVHKNPGIHEVAELLGMNPAVDAAQVHDVIVVGAGPAGLASAVYAASEGLDVLVIEAVAYGGQAGTSSKIENYLGFPTGISGQALAGRAFAQAQKFGAQVQIARTALKLGCDRKPYVLDVSGSHKVLARAVIIATGAAYRKLDLPNLGNFEGVGIYYGATRVEAQLCGDNEVIVVGGGNSAGQAAMFLSSQVKHVHILVRGAGLTDTMSRYLIRRIEENPRITLRPYTQITELVGDKSLEQVRWHNSKTGETELRDICHVFMMAGASPKTDWLNGCVALDDKGFVKTGQDLKKEELETFKWNLTRTPYHMETSLPGIFAVGDVRSESVKRVASAVGEGSICIQLVHRFLAE
jgi:thioredoxin reductase (NADPH)